MEARGLNNPSLWFLPHNQSYPPPPCAPPTVVGVALEHTTSYLMWFLQYTASEIFFSVRSITCTAQIVCVRPNLQPFQILYNLRFNPGGQGGRCNGGGGGVCTCLLPWGSGRVKHIGIMKIPIFIGSRDLVKPVLCAVLSPIERTAMHAPGVRKTCNQVPYTPVWRPVLHPLTSGAGWRHGSVLALVCGCIYRVEYNRI